jgi:hypothetical protein
MFESHRSSLGGIAEIVWLAFVLGFFPQIVAAGDQAATTDRKYETCRTQLEEYVEARFHQTVCRISFDFVFDYRSAGGGDGTTSTALVYTEECPGYHVFDLFATDYDCDARAHLLAAPNYVFYRTSELGC